MTSQQEVIHDSEPSAFEERTDIGSVEPTDVTAPSDVYQVTVEPHVQGDDDYKATSGGEVIPRSPIRRPFCIALAVFSGWMILCGFVLATLGAMIAGRFSKHTHRSCPALWWTGLPPTILSVIGFYTVTNKSRRYLFFWGTLVTLNLITQTAVMGVAGNFSTALYEVWPLISEHRGHPLCKVMVQRCYCQDYYHGVYSHVRMTSSQYIEEDVLWKETGYLHCDDVWFVSALYYSMMAFFAVFSLVSLIGVVVAFAGSACSPQDETDFQPLTNIGGASVEAVCTDDFYPDDSRYRQMKQMTHPTQEQPTPTDGATVASNVCVDSETGLRFSKWS